MFVISIVQAHDGAPLGRLRRAVAPPLSFITAARGVTGPPERRLLTLCQPFTDTKTTSGKTGIHLRSWKLCEEYSTK